MHSLLILTFQIPLALTLLDKCCPHDSYLTHQENYFCEKDQNRRLQIFTNSTNFLEKKEGTCFDTHPNITEFKIRNHTIVEEKQISVNFYPKCCPLGYFYQSSEHACVLSPNVDHSFITQNFIRVGLPQCKVLVDYKLTPGGYRLELGNLYVEEATRFQEGQFCVDKNEDGFLIARGCFDNLGVCKSVLCLHKCCPDGQSFVGGQRCLDTYVHGLSLNFTDRVTTEGSFAIIHGYQGKLFFLHQKNVFHIIKNGTLFAFYNQTESWSQFTVDQNIYCIEHIKKGNRDNFEFFKMVEDNLEVKFWAARWAKILSCVFIIITGVVYLFLPELLNLFGRILIAYCVATMMSFLILTYLQFFTEITDTTCKTMSFLSSYACLATFSWLNVMSFDIWCTFGTPKSVKATTQKKNEMNRFFFYNLYGWGLPALLTFITYALYAWVNTPQALKPLLGSYQCCWERISGNYGMLIYYIIPLSVMEIANVVLFIRTVFYCLKVRREINRMNDTRASVKDRTRSYNIDKDQLILILKLSIAMGIFFVFEAVSSLFDFSKNAVTKYIEAIWDTVNCLQGLFIFLIFICKVKVFRLCRNRLCGLKKKRRTYGTTSTQISEPLNSGSSSKFKMSN